MSRSIYYLLDTPCSYCTVKNLCLIRMNDTVSDGVTKTLVLNIERAQHDYLSQGIWARCIEYFLCDTGLKTQNCRQTECVSSLALLESRNVTVFQSHFLLEKGQKFHQLLSFTSSVRILCLLYVMRTNLNNDVSNDSTEVCNGYDNYVCG